MTPSETEPTLTRAPEPLTVGGVQIRLLAGTHTGAPIGAVDYVIPPGFAPPPELHRHTREDAGWFILDGEVEFAYADGTRFLATPGDSIVHPNGCWFRWSNAHDDRVARAICWFSPAGFEQFFVEVVRAADAHLAAGGTFESFAPRLHEIRARYGDEPHPHGAGAARS